MSVCINNGIYITKVTLPAIMGDYWLLDLLDDLISNSSVGKILGGDVATILSCNVCLSLHQQIY